MQPERFILRHEQGAPVLSANLVAPQAVKFTGFLTVDSLSCGFGTSDTKFELKLCSLVSQGHGQA